MHSYSGIYIHKLAYGGTNADYLSFIFGSRGRISNHRAFVTTVPGIVVVSTVPVSPQQFARLLEFIISLTLATISWLCPQHQKPG